MCVWCKHFNLSYKHRVWLVLHSELSSSDIRICLYMFILWPIRSISYEVCCFFCLSDVSFSLCFCDCQCKKKYYCNLIFFTNKNWAHKCLAVINCENLWSSLANNNEQRNTRNVRNIAKKARLNFKFQQKINHILSFIFWILKTN